ncbi:unnamed protein product [Menidia menidia]|uniref:(Atlantic silverside) hypothetical protein n=1 Tax=Menidia menidia TaxID=238744 RepID=A0A8S4AZW6_9TELE|nr:unnamed protein product [Menidia menidia]
MASGSSSLFSEEQFLCPICLDVFTRPVSTPCGHNFCMACIGSYWDGALCQCPVCKESFPRRPDLKVNTFISELAAQFVSLQVGEAGVQSAGRPPAGPPVPCDICTDAQREAVRSCLECLSSYCDVHLEPHRRAAGLKKHTLIPPEAGLEGRVCGSHGRLLTLFCAEDGAPLCAACAASHRADHRVLPVPRAYQEARVQLGQAQARAQGLLQERLRRAQGAREAARRSGAETERLRDAGVQELAALEAAVRKARAELAAAAEERQRAVEERAEGLAGEAEREMVELHAAAAALRELEQNQDPLDFLRSWAPRRPPPAAADPSPVSFNPHLEVQHAGATLKKLFSQLRALLDAVNAEISRFSSGAGGAPDEAALRYAQRHEVRVELDPDTAHPLLSLSADGRGVRYNAGAGLWANQLPKPGMFTEHLAVLAREGLPLGRSYFEVSVGRKTEWCLGVAAASVQRRGALVRDPSSGLWAIWFLEDRFETFSCPAVPVHAGRVERVGVFVDYPNGQVSFFDVDRATAIHSFADCVFTEELYPYFNPCDNEYGANLDPMEIVPVCPTE